MKNSQRLFNIHLICVGIILLLEMFYFRNILFSDKLVGDFGDGRFCMLATEHWYQVILGNESLPNLKMFYPVTGTFAYSDMFFGLAIPFVILRFAGLNMFLAFKISVILVHVLGAYSMYYLLNRKLNIGPWVSLLGVILFSYSNMANTATHPQLFAIYFIPLFVIFVLDYFQNINASFGKRCKYALLSVAMFAVIFYTGCYIGYFVLICFGIFAVWFLVSSLIWRRKELKELFLYIFHHLREYILYMAFGVALLLPYLLMYIPISGQSGKRSWGEVSGYLPRWFEFFNLDSTNLLWKNIFHVDVESLCGESTTGYPLGTFIVLVIAVISLVVLFLKNKDKKEYYYYALTGCSVITCMLLILKVGDQFSLWWLIYNFLPGAGSMRAVTRINDVLMLPVAILIAFFIFFVSKHIKVSQGIKAVLFIGCFGFAMLEYTWVGGLYSNWDESSQLAFIDSVPEPPEDCEVMFINYRDKENINQFLVTTYQLNAWQIAYKYNLECINGYTSYYPEGWELINQLYREDYVDQVKNWIDRYDLKNVYMYEVESKQWIAVD